MTQLIAINVSPNEISLGNTSEIQVLYKGATFQLPAGTTLYFEDAGTYPIKTIATEEYESGYFNLTFEESIPDDGTPNRLVFNLQAEIASLKVHLVQVTNQEAEAFRLNFITDGTGQSLTYDDKLEDALAFVAAYGSEGFDENDYPAITNEVGITAPSAYEVAQIILNMRAMFRQIGYPIERARLGRNKEISELTKLADLQALQPIDWNSLIGN